MKKIRITALMLVFALLALSGSALAAQYATVVTPTSDGTVYVRAAAGAGQPILGVAKNGDTLEILKKGNTWHRVKVLRTGLTGYMYGAYISFSRYEPDDPVEPEDDYIPDASVADTDTVLNKSGSVYSSDGYANLRWGPSTGFAVMGRLYNGDSVWVLEQNSTWYRVRDKNGRIGYVSRSLIRTDTTISNPPGRKGIIRSNDGFAMVRSGPGTSYSALYSINAGQSITAYGCSGEWLRVSSSSSWTEAYIYRGLVRFYSAAKTTGNVYLRTGPSTSYGKKGVVSSGANVTLLATDGSFCRVDTGYAIGYLSAKYLSF